MSKNKSELRKVLDNMIDSARLAWQYNFDDWDWDMVIIVIAEILLLLVIIDVPPILPAFGLYLLLVIEIFYRAPIRWKKEKTRLIKYVESCEYELELVHRMYVDLLSYNSNKQKEDNNE